MERNLHYDSFERFLKDSVEDFKMYPSRRVWTSLYNNLHPGRRWPSMSVCILLISAIIFIGFSNNSVQQKNLMAKQGQKNVLLSALTPTEQQIQQNAASPINANKDLKNNQLPVLLAENNKKDEPSQNERMAGAGNSNERNESSVIKTAPTDQISFTGNQTKKKKKSKSNSRSLTDVAFTTSQPEEYTADEMALTSDNARNLTNAVLAPSIEDGNGLLINLPVTAPVISVLHSQLLQAEASINTDREWIDNFAFYNKPKTRLRNKLTYQIYATPSIGFRTLEKNTTANPYTALPTAGNASLVEEKDRSIVHTPALNLEAGYSLQYNLNKAFRIKGGLQLNYANYFIHATELNHPMATTLLINDPVTGTVQPVFKSSTISNTHDGGQERKYSNNSFQLSLPIGADVRLAGNSRFQWYAGATIQPTYVLSGNAFLLSSDMNNYVFDAGFVRKWNLHAGVETFVSYKVNKAVMINAGPQFRYQFRSSFSDRYTYNDRMNNLGIKLGIVQQF